VNDVVDGVRPLVRRRIAHLRGDVGTARVEPFEQLGLLARGREHLGREAPVQVEEMRADVRLELDRKRDGLEPRRPG